MFPLGSGSWARPSVRPRSDHRVMVEKTMDSELRGRYLNPGEALLVLEDHHLLNRCGFGSYNLCFIFCFLFFPGSATTRVILTVTWLLWCS